MNFMSNGRLFEKHSNLAKYWERIERLPKFCDYWADDEKCIKVPFNNKHAKINNLWTLRDYRETSILVSRWLYFTLIKLYLITDQLIIIIALKCRIPATSKQVDPQLTPQIHHWAYRRSPALRTNTWRLMPLSGRRMVHWCLQQDAESLVVEKKRTIQQSCKVSSTSSNDYNSRKLMRRMCNLKIGFVAWPSSSNELRSWHRSQTKKQKSYLRRGKGTRKTCRRRCCWRSRRGGKRNLNASRTCRQGSSITKRRFRTSKPSGIQHKKRNSSWLRKSKKVTIEESWIKRRNWTPRRHKQSLYNSKSANSLHTSTKAGKYTNKTMPPSTGTSMISVSRTFHLRRTRSSSWRMSSNTWSIPLVKRSRINRKRLKTCTQWSSCATRKHTWMSRSR